MQGKIRQIRFDFLVEYAELTRLADFEIKDVSLNFCYYFQVVNSIRHIFLQY